MIRVARLTKFFDGQVVLDDVSLEVHDGELVVLLGASGEGKTVLLKHLIGLLKPDRGEVYIDQTKISDLDEKELLKIRRNMGYLFQEGALYDFFNVSENVAFPLCEHTRMSKKEIKKKVEEILKMVDLVGVGDKFPSELSGGMKKRAALARCIILGSKIILCDEPTSGLDPIRSRDISDLIKNVSKRLRCTTVVTSHDITNSFRIADRIAIIHDNKIVAFGTPEEIRTSGQPYVREFIST